MNGDERMRGLDRILGEVERPARYLGGEKNSVVKDHAGVPIRVVLAFPDMYEIGMSHLGLRILYSVLNRSEDMLLERCFTPWPDMEAALRREHIPLFSLETRTPIAAFDVIGFSLQYELCFTNVLTMLDLAGLPFRAADRDESHPLIVAGGPVAFSPEPVADFFDAILIGDGEESFPALLRRHAELKARWSDLRTGSREERREARRRVLAGIADIPGLYVPSLYEVERDPYCGLDFVRPRTAADVSPPPFPIRRAVLDDLRRFPFPTDTVVPHAEIVHDRVSVEIARGCTEGCRFCQAGYIYRPVRERSAEEIMNAAICGLKDTGYSEVTLSSLSPADYSSLPLLVEKMMDAVADSQVGLAVSSLRPYGLTEGLARQISRVTRTGFTIAPDAGTQRMRDVLNKGITEEHILSAAKNAFGEGWDLIKLYFIIGLPTETEADLEGMVDLAHRIWEIGRRELGARNRGTNGRCVPRVHFSASSLVPKPHTPFQWVAMESAASLHQKERFIASRVRNRRIRFKHHHVETSRLEGLLSRGDRRLSRVIERAWALGCRLDGWTEHMRWDLWCRAMEAEGLTFDEYLKALPLESRLPWDHIDTTVKKEFLLREWKRAGKAALTPACEKPYRKFNRPFQENDKLVCYDCGTDCDLPAVKAERVENHRQLIQLLPAMKPLGAADPTRPPVRYRAAFEKTGVARHLGHLDVTRALTRAFRRAEIPVRLTQGFNPKPAFAFGPALALGIEGREEFFDFAIGEPLPGATLVAKLNAALPDGLRLLRAELIAAGAPPLAASVRNAHYSVSLPLWIEPAPILALEGKTRVSEMPFNEESALRDEREGGDVSAEDGGPPGRDLAVASGANLAVASPVSPLGGSADWHRDRLAAFELAAAVPIEKVRKARRSEVDLKHFAHEFELREDREELRLAFSVRYLDGASVRPEEVLVGIYGFFPRGARIVREGLSFEARVAAREPVVAPVS